MSPFSPEYGEPPEEKQQYVFLDTEPKRGGMAFVRKARHLPTGKIVAVKHLLNESSPDRARVHALLAEFGTMRSLYHRCIVRERCMAWNGASPRIVMEWLNGMTLCESLRMENLHRGELLQPERHSREFSTILRVLMHVARALEHAHLRGILHKDVKPANVMVQPDQPAKLIDWGLAERVQPGTGATLASPITCGTPSYLSPEGAKGRPLTQLCDAFGLGALLYESLAQRPPYSDATPQECLVKASRAEITPLETLNPHVPKEISDACASALALKPEDRMPVAVFRKTIRAWLIKLRPASDAGVSAFPASALADPCPG